MCVRIFGPKNASNSEHFAKITSNGHLFVQLGWLSQIGRSFEIRHFENSCASFWCSRDNFRCMNFNKAFIGQRVPKQLANSSLYPEKKKKDWLENAYFLTFIYSEKATKFCEISFLLLSYVVPGGDFSKFCCLLSIYELWIIETYNWYVGSRLPGRVILLGFQQFKKVKI